MGSNPITATSISDIASVLSKEFLHIYTTAECRFTLKCLCDKIKIHSLLVTLAIFLSTFTRKHFVSTFFSRGILLVVTESHAPLTSSIGLITNRLVDWYGQGTWLQVGQLPIKAGWRDVPITFCNLAKAFKHYYIFGFPFPEAIKTITRFIIVTVWWSLESESGLYIERPITWYWNCNWKKRTLILTFNFDIQNCQRFVP